MTACSNDTVFTLKTADERGTILLFRGDKKWCASLHAGMFRRGKLLSVAAVQLSCEEARELAASLLAFAEKQ